MPILTFGPNTTDDHAGLDDTTLNSNDPTANKSAVTDIGVAKYAVGDHANGVLRFTGLSNLPSGITVTEARLYLSVLFNSTPSGYTVTAYRILRNVVITETTWNVYSTGNNWQTAGALGAADRSASIGSYVFAGTEAPDTRLYLTGAGLAQAVEDYANGVISDVAILLERTDGQDDENYVAFYSSEEETGDGDWPSLYVDYEEGGAAASPRNLLLLGVG